ncbi:MAG TPA: lytic transglycosylase domain-containing protein [Thermoanaerobaculia bacterium]|nr:lytic transglycosylase domain-containing protein [Thermoanaerobaculia bacterium]
MSARLVSGLYAYQSHDLLRAQELLAASPTPGGALEDWRLYLLAASALARGEQDVAQTAYARLLVSCPRSPLRGQTYVAATDLARRREQTPQALEWIAAARREELDGEDSAHLEDLAWQIGKESSDTTVLREAGRRLLIQAPLSASSRAVPRSFHALGGGELDSAALSTDEVKRRALSFLDGSRLAAAAVTTLEGIAAAERDTEWHLLQARALVAGGHGQEALAVLAGATAQGVAELASLEGAKAEAASMAAGGVGGGARRLPPAERQRLLAEAHGHLMSAVQLGGGLQAAPVRRLYSQFQAAGLADAALDALRALRRIDPADTTGAATLWERGWNAYRTGGDAAAPVAIAAWQLLQDLYPGSGDGQRGLYWQARALERTGDGEKARALYRELVATSDTSDFYGRQALSRLGQDPGPDWAGVRVRSAGPWRIDPYLVQAKLLTDLGLDDLATRALELAARKANARDLLGLKAIILGRRGQQAESLILLRQAFPALGTAYQAAVPQEILRAYYPLEFGAEIRACAAREHLPAWLVAGVIRQESAFNPRATSRVGARGLMQLMPETARETAHRLGISYRPADLYDPEVSLRLGTAYLHELLDDFHGNLELALAGYNGGPNRIGRLWQKAGSAAVTGTAAGLDDFVENLALDESRNYIKRILVLADSYRQLYPEAG